MVFFIHLYKCLILSDHVFRLLVWNFNHYKNSMKKLFALIAVFLMPLTMFAQRQAGEFSLQPKIGLTFSDVSGIDNTAYKAGIKAGVEAEYMATKWLGVTLGIDYSERGCGFDKFIWGYAYLKGPLEDPGTGQIDDDMYDKELKFWQEDGDGHKVKLSYLSVPVMANFYIYKGLAVKAGVQVDFMLSAKYPRGYKEIFDGLPWDGKYTDIKDRCRKVDVTIPLGLSYEYKRFVLDARYEFGLLDIKDDEIVVKNLSTDGTSYFLEYYLLNGKLKRSSAFTLTLGYRLGL